MISHQSKASHSFSLAVLAIICAIFLFDVQGAIIKHLGGRYPVPQISMFRNLLGTIPSLMVLFLTASWHRQGRPVRLLRWRLAMGRGLMVASAQLFFYFALIHMELATATTLAFSGPLFITALSVPLLGHSVGIWRILAVAGGFFGVVLVMQPNVDSFTWITLFPVVAAFFYALSSVSARLFDDTVPSALLNLYSALIAAIVMTFITIGGLLMGVDSWTPFQSTTDMLWLLAMGMVGGMAVLLLTVSYRLAEPGSLSPFEYFGIPFSFVLGWVFFAESPFGRLFPGVLFIVGGGLLVLWRERQATQSPNQ